MTQSEVILVTGASRGIGRALAEAFVTSGAIVWGTATTARGVAELPADVVGFELDATDPRQCAELSVAIAASHGRLDVLVNNAAILGPRRVLTEVSPAQWRRTLDVNATGPFLITTACYPLLGRRSAIVNVSSSVGRVGRGGWGPYACSKHALEGLTETLADEGRDLGHIVFSVNPGGTATDMRAEAFPDEDPATLPTAAEIAATISLLVRMRHPQWNGAKFDCREVLPFVGLDCAVEEIPRVG